ncbi:MAG TPA: c-type cytochrome domain-containing protein [Verrucomicrobiales bacterium]|nr:c-type cytochrome domain-containing protein [Verrucomicrobiales bacterium]
MTLAGCHSPGNAPDSTLPSLNDPAPLPPRPVDFAAEIKPVFKQKCVMCHNTVILPGRLGLESAEQAFRPLPKGPAIAPGHPENSRLVQGLRVSEESEDTMPPAGHRVTPSELALIETWIRQGAAWPRGTAGRVPYDPVPFDDHERGIVHPGQP